MSVLDMSFRAIGVRAGSFWVRVACVPSSSLLLIVYTSSCTCFATRIALCVCCFLSIFVVAVWRCSLKDGTEPFSLDVVVARGLSERWRVILLFTFHVLADLTCLLLMECVLWCAAEGIALVVLFTSAFFLKSVFAMCVSITVSDSDRGG